MLPELPKKNKSLERTLDGKVNDWLMANYPNDYLLEVKVKGGKLSPHQKKKLLEVEDGVFSYKFPDGFLRTPCDYVGLKYGIALVCVIDGRDVVCTPNRKEELNFTFSI